MSEATPPVEAPPVETPPVETPPAGWRDGLDAELKDHPSLAKYDDVPALAKGFLESQKLVGAKGVIRPAEGATPEEMGTFYNSMGRPETVDGYELGEFQPPEVLKEFWDTEGMSGMVGKMHERGLSTEQAQGLLSDFAEYQAGTYGEAVKNASEGKTAAGEALKTKWGLAYGAKIDLAKRTMGEAAAAVGMSATDLAGRFLPEGGMVGNDPVLTEIFALIGEGSAELKFVGGRKSSVSVLAPEEADAEIAKLEAHEGYADGRHAEHKVIIAKLDALYKQKYPETQEQKA